MNKIRLWAVRRWLQGWLAVLLGLGLFGFPAGKVDALQQDVPRFEPAPCMVDLPAGVNEGTRVNCGYLVVPEEYRNPGGDTFRLAVVVIKSQSQNPAPDPLFIMQGGPGGSTVEDYTLGLFSNPRVLPGVNRDIVLFDQRGTLHSEPNLICQELDQLTIETLNQDLSDEEADRLYFETLQQCRDRLVGSGINLSAFDSFENASDVEALRQALGYEQINLYGVSYASLLALNVMRFHPQGLRSVIIDAVLPPQQNFMTHTVQTQMRSFRMLFETCAADSACNSAYPNLEQVFYTLVDRLNAEPTQIQLTDIETGQVYPAIYDGEALIHIVFQMLYMTEMLPLIPRVIDDARAGEFGVIERIESLLVFESNISSGMYYSVMCAEDADFELEDIDLSDLPPQILAMEEDSGELFQRTCQIWDVEPLGEAADEPVTSDVPTLVLSGAYDPVTPPQFAELVAEGLSNSYDYTFPAGAHGALMKGECQDSIILAFLNNPNREPETSCIAENQTLEFVTPKSVIRMPVLIRLLNLQGNSNVELLLFGAGLLFLMTAFIVYPLVGLVRLFTRKPAPATRVPLSDPTGYPYTGQTETVPASAPRPLAWRRAPWLAMLSGLLLLIFSVVWISTIFDMVAQNDVRFLVGLPASMAPYFILPLLALLLLVGMIALALTAWRRGWGSVWGRLYFTMLSLSTLVVLAVMGVWGILTALFAG